MDQQEVCRLRVEESLGIKELAVLSGKAKSTISLWCRGLKPKNPDRLCQHVRQNGLIGSAAAKAKWDEVKRIAAEEARAEWPQIKLDPEMMLLLGLYWGEGTKRGIIGITNGDPWLILAALRMLRKLTRANASGVIIYYPEHRPEDLLRFWSEKLGGVRLKIKPVHDKRASRRPGKLKHGLCALTMSDWKLETKIRTWIDCIK